MLPLRLKFSTKGLEPKKGADLKPLLGVGDRGWGFFERSNIFTSTVIKKGGISPYLPSLSPSFLVIWSTRMTSFHSKTRFGCLTDVSAANYLPPPLPHAGRKNTGKYKGTHPPPAIVLPRYYPSTTQVLPKYYPSTTQVLPK